MIDATPLGELTARVMDHIERLGPVLGDGYVIRTAAIVVELDSPKTGRLVCLGSDDIEIDPTQELPTRSAVQATTWDFDRINKDVPKYRRLESLGGATAAASLSAGEPVWVIDSGTPANQAKQS